MSNLDLPADDKQFIKEKTIEGWEPEMIGYELRKNGSMLRDETVEKYLAQDRVQADIELEKEIMEKKSEVSREDLIRELSEQKDYIIRKREELSGSSEEISDQQTKNLLKAIRQLGEMIDILDAKDSGGANNVINVNNLEQNFDVTNSVQYLPAEDKTSIVEQLESDPDVEDFIIVRQDEVEEIVER